MYVLLYAKGRVVPLGFVRPGSYIRFRDRMYVDSLNLKI